MSVNKTPILNIDGSYGEGGGAIIRLAIAMSVVTQTPVKITNIRKGRSTPGLRAQHVAGIKAASDLCNAKIKGVEIGSTELEFYPNPISKDEITININTAGSVGLILQLLQLACVKTSHPIKIHVNGGADFGKFAPPVIYLQNITLRALHKMGYSVHIKIHKHGFYPKGQGKYEIDIKPSELKKFNPDTQEEIIKVFSVATAHLKKAKVAERQIPNIEAEIKTYYVEAPNPGSGIIISKGFIGSDALGERGIKAEHVGQAALDEFNKTILSKASVDKHLADQLIPFIALAGGSFTTNILTSHTKTNIWLIEKFLDIDFKISKNDNYKIEVIK